MIRDKKYRLLAKPKEGFGIYQSILKEETGWQFLNFQARLMKKGEKWKGNTWENEYAIILLGGNYSVKTDKGNWETINGAKMFLAESLIRCTFQEIQNLKSRQKVKCLILLMVGAKQTRIILFISNARRKQPLKFVAVTMQRVKSTVYCNPVSIVTGWFVLKFTRLRETGVRFRRTNTIRRNLTMTEW
jgi:hypothetical protein